MTILADKSALQSWTVWGGVLLGLGQLLEQSGILVPGTSASLSTVASAVGAFLALVGIRRKLGEPAPTA